MFQFTRKGTLLRLSAFSLLTIAIAAHSLSWIEIPAIARLELILYDARTNYIAPSELDPRIVIVDIDEKSLIEKDSGGEGHWPWSRNRIAVLFQKLIDEQDVSIIGVDFIFSEKDTSSGLLVLQNLASKELQGNKQFTDAVQKLTPSLEYDTQLAKQIGRTKVVLGAAFHNQRLDQKPPLLGGIPTEAFSESSFAVHTYPSAVAPIAEFQKAASAVGHLNPIRDPDGITRRVPMFVEFQHQLFPALSLAVISIITGDSSIKGTSENYFGAFKKIESISVGGIAIAVDKDLNALIPYRKNKKSFSYVSAIDILNGTIPIKNLQNKIVLIGTSATGLTDYVSTPLGVTLPGVEVHANMISGMLDERIPTEPNYVVGIDFLFVVLIGILMAWASFKLRPAKLMLLTLTLTISLLSFNYWILAAHHLLLPISAPLSCIFGIYLFQASYGYFIESRAKKQVTEMFSSYVPPDLVEVIARDPEVFNMKATEKNLTVLFVNIREFSSIAEKLSPHDLAEWINMYLSLVSEIISVQNKGTLDKYMGDSVMAFWGAPLPDDNHAEHAVSAAIQIKQSAEQLNFKFRQRGWPTMALSIGINTGLMHVGDMGSNIRRAYTVMGDAVNIAAQIQTLTRQYGIDILMASQTAAELKIFEFRAIDCVKFPGRRHVIELFEPIAKKTELTPEAISDLNSWKESLQFYRSEEWESALHKLNELNSANPTSFLYALYKRRVEAFILNPNIIEVDKSFKVPTRNVQNFLKADFPTKTEI